MQSMLQSSKYPKKNNNTPMSEHKARLQRSAFLLWGFVSLTEFGFDPCSCIKSLQIKGISRHLCESDSIDF